MDDEDYRALIEIVVEELALSGAPDIASEGYYTFPDAETGECRLHSPLKRLTEMLRAFERFMAIQDRTVAESALADIKRAINGEAPTHAVVELPDDERTHEIHLEEAPDLFKIRRDVDELVNLLLEGGFSHGEEV